MSVKRSREEVDIEKLAMANCLLLLSRVGENNNGKPLKDGRMFECKTCKRQFHSFQALGGHRASHKKLRLMASDLLLQSGLNSSPPKPKTHVCSICGLEFAMGQALGGHMRRHRAAAMGEEMEVTAQPAMKMVPILKRSNSKRVFGFDLNLMPYENDLQPLKTAPAAATAI